MEYDEIFKKSIRLQTVTFYNTLHRNAMLFFVNFLQCNTCSCVFKKSWTYGIEKRRDSNVSSFIATLLSPLFVIKANYKNFYLYHRITSLQTYICQVHNQITSFCRLCIYVLVHKPLRASLSINTCGFLNCFNFVPLNTIFSSFLFRQNA